MKQVKIRWRKDNSIFFSRDGLGHERNAGDFDIVSGSEAKPLVAANMVTVVEEATDRASAKGMVTKVTSQPCKNCGDKTKKNLLPTANTQAAQKIEDAFDAPLFGEEEDDE